MCRLDIRKTPTLLNFLLDIAVLCFSRLHWCTKSKSCAPIHKTFAGGCFHLMLHCSFGVRAVPCGGSAGGAGLCAVPVQRVDYAAFISLATAEIRRQKKVPPHSLCILPAISYRTGHRRLDQPGRPRSWRSSKNFSSSLGSAVRNTCSQST